MGGIRQIQEKSPVFGPITEKEHIKAQLGVRSVQVGAADLQGGAAAPNLIADPSLIKVVPVQKKLTPEELRALKIKMSKAVVQFILTVNKTDELGGKGSFKDHLGQEKWGRLNTLSAEIKKDTELKAPSSVSYLGEALSLVGLGVQYWMQANNTNKVPEKLVRLVKKLHADALKLGIESDLYKVLKKIQ